MGRIGDVLKKIGRGAARVGKGLWTGAKWVGNNVVRPVASIISHPAAQALLTTVGGPYGKLISTVGGAVNAGINIMDGITGGPKKVS